jgi:ATP-dependent Clp protease ATP-binding subunit ClpA
MDFPNIKKMHAKSTSDFSRGIGDFSCTALDFIVDHGFDPVYGARPMKRAIQRSTQDPLAIRILEGAYKDNEEVNVNHQEDADGLSST